MSHWETIWEFRTRHFLVTFDVTPEECDPADSFEFAEDIEAVRSGAVDWFTARVAVYLLDGRGDRGDSLRVGTAIRTGVGSTGVFAG